MGSLTISLDDAVIKQARVRAIQEGTSVSAKVREFLATYAQVNDQKRQAGQAILEAARQSQATAPEPPGRETTCMTGLRHRLTRRHLAQHDLFF